MNNSIKLFQAFTPLPSIFGMLFLCMLLVYLTSCGKTELAPDAVEIEYVNEANPQLPLALPYHEMENTGKKPLAMNPVYQDLNKRTRLATQFTMDIEAEPNCSYFDFYTCEDEYDDCGYCTYLAHYCYWSKYFYWFHNPSFENCNNMKQAYCDYLTTHRNCYGGDPVTHDDCFAGFTCN